MVKYVGLCECGRRLTEAASRKRCCPTCGRILNGYFIDRKQECLRRLQKEVGCPTTGNTAPVE